MRTGASPDSNEAFTKRIDSTTECALRIQNLQIELDFEVITTAREQTQDHNRYHPFIVND